MIRYVTKTELAAMPRLEDSMFQDRRRQFRDRLKWPVTVDARGWEQDQYDALDPLYVIWQRRDGTHGGSMRFLPTEGRTMVNEHFWHLSKRRVAGDGIWECTRFCLAPGADPVVTAGLMLAGAELGIGRGLSHAVGVFDASMLRVYRGLRWMPEILGREAGVGVGLWRFGPELRHRLARRAGVEVAMGRWWYRRAFG